MQIRPGFVPDGMSRLVTAVRYASRKETITMNASKKPGNTIAQESRTVGLDLGDKFSHYCVLAESGDVVEEGRIKTTCEGFTSHFQGVPRMRIALETGIHSAWVSQLLTSFGHDVIVANAGQIPAITGSDKKTDPNDAENLARFARFDPKLLHPITHRDKSKQMDLTVIRVRARLVEVRTTLINSVRSTVKSFGDRLPRCVADSFATRVKEALPAELRDVLQPVLDLIHDMTVRIKAYDEMIEAIARQKYPEAGILRSVPGVGPIASLTFVLTLGDPRRFENSRDVGAYLGLRPKRAQSGDRDPQLRITKAGDSYLRKTLVQCAHYILGPLGPDSALRRWGLGLVRGGANGKKRAITAVTRKLAVLLHRLWTKRETFQPFPPESRAGTEC
jgi:transposase